MSRGVLKDASVLVGASQVTLLATDSARTFLFICNGHASQTLTVNLAGGTAAANTIGCVTLAPGGTILMDDGVPTGPITAIASGASTPATVQSIQGGSESF